MEIVFSCLLALLVYSGPVIPMLVPLFFRRASHQRFRRNVWALIILASVQGLAFLPYIYAVTTDQSDSLYRLYLPFFVGIPMFIGASVYAVCECIRLRGSRAA
jgi:hypothetical protein